MPGPNSAPNGNKLLTIAAFREEAAKKGRLFTGKTEKDTASGKWARRLNNRKARADRDNAAARGFGGGKGKK